VIDVIAARDHVQGLVVRAGGEQLLFRLRPQEVEVAGVLDVGGKKVRLASEDDLARDYPDFELGAVPPLGGRDDLVIIDERLARRDSVIVEAGTHDRSVRLKTSDLVRLTGAQVADICREEPTAG
jgi:prolyl-tRNA editing enzyme YbaK/EbsC (Cys-tRNA(Pro) deacylase)